jgi:predicted transcriptional regulator
MVVQLTNEQEAQLARMAAQAGRNVEELAREAVDRYLTEETRFHASVRAGQEAAARGDFVPASEVWANIERELQP